MKVLLVKPQNISDHIQPCLGLMYLATQIRKKHAVAIHDCIKSNTSAEKIIDVIQEHNPDVVGVQCYTFDVPHIYQILKLIKNAFPEKITVVGGAHISSIPAEAFQQLSPFIDYGFKGEAEIGFPKLLDILESKSFNPITADPPSNFSSPPVDYPCPQQTKISPAPLLTSSEVAENELSQVEGLIWRNTHGHIVVNDPYFVEDLDSLGFPAWDLMPPETYPESQHGAFYKKFPIAPIIITRGCPYKCRFCSAPILSGKHIRRHSVAYVRKHIQMLYERGIREFHIVDDNFTFDAAHCKEILQGIIALHLDISLALPNGIRLDRVNDEILALMKEAGVYLISVAIESGSDRILKKMNKATTVERMRQDVARIKKHGFPLAGFFILGYPGETREDIEATIRLSKELGLLRANFFTYLPLPGTAEYNELVEFGKIKEVDWKNFLFMTAPFVPEGMTRKELLAFKQKAFWNFYLNPSILIANIMGIRSFRHFLFLAKRFYHWVLMPPQK